MGEPQHTAGRPVGILTALDEEQRLLVDALEARTEQAGVGLTTWSGRLDGCAVVIAPSGVGKVNAATVATLLIERHECAALILSGVAGGLGAGLGIGDSVIATRVIDVDYGRWTDAGRILYQPGDMPLPGATARPGAGDGPGYRLSAGLEADVRRRLASSGDEAALGTILSGDAFLASSAVRDELAARWSALAIEMEGSAVCGVAERFGVPWLIVRALSDRAGEESVTDFGAFLASAAARSAELVRVLLPVVADPSSSLGR